MNSLTPTIVEYCFYSINDSHTEIVDVLNTRDQNYTFDGLRHMNVTAYEILFWSGSIDLAERYQFYIDQHNKSLLSNEIFFNCTQPWFGSRCQYSLELYETKSLVDLPSSLSSINIPCYTLLECDRGSLFLCLDWREICDGRIDCLNDGVDEAQCYDLEINECNDNEYRCHNGLCIPKDSKEIDHVTARCLDQSDIWDLPQCPNTDLMFDLFQCEETTCRAGSKKFSCGDGQCVDDFDECHNGRHLMLAKSISSQGNLSHHCWIAMTCLTKIIDQINGTLCEQFFQSSYVINYLHNCEVLIQFPIIPVLFGHIRFLYRPKDIFAVNISLALPPDYICYDEQLCSFFSPTFRTESYTCEYADQMGFKSNVEYKSWKSIIDAVKSYFRGCIIGYDQKYPSEHSSLYLCKNSSKYISKHRILDNISDCHLNDDEQDFELSCSIDNPNRFKCFDEVQCQSPLVSPHICPSTKEVNQNINKILFNQICDRTIDILPELIDGQNHTDETNCERWPCNNIYTRCDGFWNCVNGEDEENCRQSICPRHFLDCISPYNYSVVCLPIDQVSNGIVDCLGGIDELQLCQIADYNNGISYRFRCLNDTKCVDFSDPCNLNSNCPFNDNKILCKGHQSRCEKWTPDNNADIENILCRISTLRRIPFTLKTSQPYPPVENQMIDHTTDWTVKQSDDINDMESEFKDLSLSSRCIRGISVYLWLGNENYSSICFCPRNYYGTMCEYQNQRVSLTLTLLSMNKHSIYAIFVKLMDDDNDLEEINSHDQLIYVSKRSCKQPFNMYLLYSTRPKNLSKNYSIHIDAYRKTSLEYLASWHAKIPFLFLPVNRLAIILTLPTNQILNPSYCPLQCEKGVCMKYINEEKFFCQCSPGWSGARCQIAVNCNDCSSDSICVGAIHNRSICVCSLEKFGSHCLLRHSCPVNYCKNSGQCIVVDQRMIDDSYLCFCPEEFDGNRCQNSKAKLEISFRNMEVLSHLVAYIYSFVYFEPPLVLQTILKKLTKVQSTVTLHLQYLFQIVFIKMNNNYYLAVLQQVETSNISTSIDSTRRCPSINELLKSEQLKLPRIERVKYYHTPCQTFHNLKCFFDESYMCLCTMEHYPNCFLFDHQSNFLCHQRVHCQNGGQCLQDHLICPVTTICVCIDCFYGDRCQFYAKGIGLTLDDILRYAIEPNINFNSQSRFIKVSAVLTMIIFVVGFIDSVLSLLAFKSQDSRKVGCGIYLFASSITSVLTVIMLVIKFWFVLLTQMNSSIDRSVIHVGCLVIEPILKLFLYMNNWLNACVAIERAVHVVKGVQFNKLTSKRVARRIIVLLPFLIIGSNIYESLFRDLFDDHEEQRVWCVTLYSRSHHNYHTVILFFHFLTPFCVNLFSAIFIILTISRQRAVIQTRNCYNQHLREQFYQHKQLIISPMVLVLLSLPLFIISLLSGCVKTARDSWLYLSSYFISFIPSAIVFIIFVLPSDLYKKEFKKSINGVARRYGISFFQLS